MKKLFLNLALFTMAMTACAEQVKVSGKLTDLESDSICAVMMNEGGNQQESVTKFACNDGAFSFSLDLAETRQVAFCANPKQGERMFQKGYIMLYLIPGQEVKISGAFRDYHLDGSQFYKDLEEIGNGQEPFQKEMMSINDEFSKGIQAGLNRDSLSQALQGRYTAASEKLQKYNMDYIKANPKKDASLTLVAEMRENAEEALALLDENVKKGPLAIVAQNVQRQIDREKARKEASKKVADGMPAPDFTLTDINGKPLALSSLRGKYVILDFWGSWCGWCIKGFPQMKEYYKKYAGKFEILGIDCNDTEEKWKDAVKKHELPWLHVYNPRTSSVTTEYAITGYPTKIVVGPDGKIAKTIVGEDPRFYDYLDSLFK